MVMHKSFLPVLWVALFCIVELSSYAYAQQSAPAAEMGATSGEVSVLESPRNEIVEPTQSAAELVEIRSILFLPQEYEAIQDAKRSRGAVRVLSAEELSRSIGDIESYKERVKPPPEERDITLGGIVYVHDNDWTIWLNGKRITPDALPKEIIDLRVYSEHIEVKWYDDWTNKIIPLRMRAHQRFNIDTRIFLPG